MKPQAPHSTFTKNRLSSLSNKPRESAPKKLAALLEEVHVSAPGRLQVEHPEVAWRYLL